MNSEETQRYEEKLIETFRVMKALINNPSFPGSEINLVIRDNSDDTITEISVRKISLHN